MFFEVILFILFILYLFNSFGFREKNLDGLKTLPGPSIKLPYLGHFLYYIKWSEKDKAPFVIFDKIGKLYGPLARVKCGVIDQVIVQDLDTAKKILCSETWVNRHFDEFFQQRSFGQELGIIFIDGDVWREMRRFTIRTLRDFGFGKQKSMDGTLAEELEVVIENIDRKCDQSADTPVCMRQFFTVSILNILWSMIAGYRFHHDDKKLQKLLSLSDNCAKEHPIGNNLAQAFPITASFIHKYTGPGRRRNEFITGMHEFFREILQERRLEAIYKEDQRDFIDVFLKEIDDHKSNLNRNKPNYYTDEQFLIVCLDLFVAGSETTSNTLEFGVLYTALNPRVQEKVQEEIDEIIGTSRMPCLQDKEKMPYTEATILEIQRMASVLPVIIRKNTQDTNLENYHVPKGMVAVINLQRMHYDEKIWKNPYEFRPERFLSEDGKKVVNSHNILPFGLGKRLCLGEVLAKATLFTYYTTILQRYKIALPDPTERPSTDPVPGFTLSPKEYNVVFTKRF